MEVVVLNGLILFLAVLLSIAKYFSTKLAGLLETKYQWKILSFSGGAMIGVVFLILIPEVVAHSSSCEMCFFTIMLGFTTFHLIEKYLYQHVVDTTELVKDLKELHEIGFFIDHIIVGFVFAASLEISEDFFLELILLSPLFLQTISSAMALEAIDQGTETIINEILLVSAPIIGAGIAIIVEIELGTGIETLFLSFAVGLLLFIVSRDVIPQQEKGSPLLFLIGLTLCTSFWFISLQLV